MPNKDNIVIVDNSTVVDRRTALSNEQCFKALAEHTGKVIFEWDFEKNKISSVTNFKALFGRDAATNSSADDAINARVIHEDDRKVFAQIFATIKTGNPVTDVKFRVMDGNGIFHWCSLTGLVVKDTLGMPYKALAFLENIDDRVKQEAALRHKAERDQLTGLYNKITTEHLIKETLKLRRYSDDRHALMIIDIDNFKSINDKLGHLYGDIVLTQLADLLKPLFRSDDVVGRVGGDEFFIFLKNYKSTELLTSKVAEICRLFRKTYTEGNASVNISASVGIAMCPEHGSEFDEIYKAADTALYVSKANGKDQFAFFDGQTGTGNAYQATRTEIDMLDGVQKSFKDNRIEYIFKLLYGSDDKRAAVSSVLRLIAEQYGMSRVNIYEMDYRREFVSCTFEWCADGFEATIESQQNIPNEWFDFIRDEFSKSGGMFIKKTAELPADFWKANIYFAIADNNYVVGSITFQECVKDDITLSQADFAEINTMCQVLSTFILKERAAERERQQSMVLRSVLDKMGDYAYVIDATSYEIMYENQSCVSISGKSNIGKKCFAAYLDEDKPCHFCPVKDLAGGADRGVVEAYNHVFNVHVKIFCSPIEWLEGQRAYLIDCQNVSEYKGGNKA